MDFSCFGVSGCASGSDLAAAVMALSSCKEGITTEGRLDILDIVFHLSAIGSAQADDPQRVAVVHKSHVVEELSLWRERNHAQFVVAEAIIHPNQRSFPIEFAGQSERNAMLGQIRCILGGIELGLHNLL